MEALRSLSKILMIPPVGILLYDLIYGWFVMARIKLRTLQEVWTAFDRSSYNAARPFIESLLTPEGANKLLGWPAPLSLAILPIGLYVVYWVSFRLSGGKKAGAYTYRSNQ